ncbi:MAG: hypothetical protein K2N23_03760 [Clostridia bacterium]|nr:hypothetical protein [Clostridia bacterium]
MNNIDIYYRAFKEYRKETANNTSCEKDRKAISKSNTGKDKLNTIKYLCIIDEEWIKHIEEGLEFVEKAVQEERQFIRVNGEVVPIEKVKRISKDSVEHLAKHSEMITHVPEEDTDNIVPDKLYMVEKLSDYAVYENRFLYMLLSYLRDFIMFRLEKIETLRRTYISNLSVSKKIETKKRKFTLETKIHEERLDNPYPIADKTSAAIVKRIENCQSIINMLLDTDLMVQVAKTPMIKPPIVKTNVLKMNNNFKKALALYDYIASYKGLGFTYEEVKSDFAPYSEQLADELAESFLMTSFTAYKVGNGIEDLLESAYEEEEKHRKETENKKLEERLKRLKKRALESNKTLEEYVLLLDERNRMLERDSEELAVVRQEITALNHRIDVITLEKKELNRRLTELSGQIDEKDREIASLNQKYIEDTTSLKNAHEQEIVTIKADCEQQLEAKQLEFAEKMQATISEYETKFNELNEQKSQLEETAREVKEKEETLDSEIARREKEIEEKYRTDYEEKAKEAKKTADAAVKELALVRGELDGMRAQYGKIEPSTDYASRERFVELQEAYVAFERFFKAQWKITKKQIRKQVFWAKQEKKSKKAKLEDKKS